MSKIIIIYTAYTVYRIPFVPQQSILYIIIQYIYIIAINNRYDAENQHIYYA